MAIAPSRIVAPFDDDDFYPSSDGEPMGETDKHVDVTMYCISALRQFFAARPDVYIAGDNFLYWEQGNRRATVSPDCYVVFGSEMRLRDTFLVWREEGRTPDVVIEITSKKTRREDTNKKHRIYEQTLRVSEYFLFDPTGEYLSPRLQGYRLEEGHYIRLEITNNRLVSEQLALELVIDGERLRFYNPASGDYLLSYEEQTQQIETEASRARFERMRAERESNRAEQATQRAEQEMQRAEQETQRAETAESELARLRVELARLQGQPGSGE